MVFIGLIILTMCIFIKFKLFGTSVDDNIVSGLCGFALGLVISEIVVGSINVFTATFSTYTNEYSLSKIDNKYPYTVVDNGNIIVRYVGETDTLQESTFDKDIVNISNQNTPTKIRITVHRENQPKDWQRILFFAPDAHYEEIESVDIY